MLSPASEEGDAAVDSVPAADQAMTVTPSQLSEQAVLHFTQKVQPTLVNRCASNACHGTRSGQQFQVARPARGQPMPYRMTVRNLQSALAFVDHEQPARSPLVAIPRVAHGGLGVPVFGQREVAQYEQLLAWVQMVAKQTASTAARSDQAAPSATAPPEFLPAGYAAPLSEEPAGDDAPAVPSDPGASASEAAPSEPVGARDPFDPEVFNRQFVDPP
jgi:hypothetical protein